jgi:hypothetical protein
MSGEEMDEILLPNDELEKIIQETVEAELGSKVYEEKEVPHWINRINEILIEKLAQQQKPYKYLVNTMVMQRKGANVVVAQSNIWDTGLDSHFTLAWPKETANKSEKSKQTIQCMVSVYAMSTLNSNSLINSEL